MAKGIKLGERYRDEITNFEGVATAEYRFLHGCIRVCLERGGENGKAEESAFDEQRLVLVKTERKPVARATSGGPRQGPPSRDPVR